MVTCGRKGSTGSAVTQPPATAPVCSTTHLTGGKEHPGSPKAHAVGTHQNSKRAASRTPQRDRSHKKSCVTSVPVRDLCWTNLDGARSTSGTQRAGTSHRPHQTSRWPAKGGPQGDPPHRERSHPTHCVHAFTCSTGAGFSQYNLTERSLLCCTRNVLHQSPADFLELNF